MDSSLISSHSPHFIKIIISEIGSKSKLMIPRNFVTKYGEELNSSVVLQTPVSTATWPVNLERQDGEICLQNGWPEFARNYSLCFGHVLVFEYQGNSRFQVLIFDKTATEIDYPVTSTTCVEEAKESKKKRKFACKNDDFEYGSASEDNKARAFAMAKAYKSEYSSFMFTMQPSYVSGRAPCLHVPKVHLEKYITRKDGGVVILQVGKRSWLVNFTISWESCRFNCGWVEFVRDNSLAVGDVCVFELVNHVNNLINVVIFRAAPSNNNI